MMAMETIRIVGRIWVPLRVWTYHWEIWIVMETPFQIKLKQLKILIMMVFLIT